MSEIVKASIFLVRHGECSGNVAQMALDPFTDVLTENGQTQAALLGKCLKDIPFTRAFASDYPRTFETAQIILQQSETAKKDILKPEIRLRERDYTGILGQKASAAISLLMDSMKKGIRYLDVEMPDSETVEQFEARIVNLLSELVQDLRKSSLKEENVLLVSHGLTNQRLMIILNKRAKDCGISQWTPNLFSERLMRNTTFHELGFEIPRDEQVPVIAGVKQAHGREHVIGETVCVAPDKRRDVRDENNYTFLEERDSDLATYEDETTHFCKPV